MAKNIIEKIIGWIFPKKAGKKTAKKAKKRGKKR